MLRYVWRLAVIGILAGSATAQESSLSDKIRAKMNAESEATRALPPEPAGPYAELDGPDISALNYGEALVEVITQVCLPASRDGAMITRGLPAGSAYGADPAVTDVLIAQPRPGDVWTVQTAEGQLLLGTMETGVEVCQILLVSPRTKLLMEEVTSGLSGLDSAFSIIGEDGMNDLAAPIHWRGLRSVDGEPIKLVHYKGVPGGRPSTLQVFVG